MANSGWIQTFFNTGVPQFAVLDEPQGLSTFQHFHVPEDSWAFGRKLSEHNGSPITVFRLYARENGMRKRYAAKTFPEYTINHALAQWYRIPSQWFSTLDIQDEHDSFLNEARAYEQITSQCQEREKVYFPKYHGVLIPIDKSKFSWHFQARNQAVVLENLTPDTSSRRILTEEPVEDPFSESPEFQRLADLALTKFEQD